MGRLQSKKKMKRSTMYASSRAITYTMGERVLKKHISCTLSCRCFAGYGMTFASSTMFESSHHHVRLSREEEMSRICDGVRPTDKDK
ncbi:hypothetical protein KIN20_000907 [Parelaphostrongylus tenuis]|uniref:Uncharacterized protein n=1 Tax=Parelaphostrongylus tenuis TaxID=148309 RepID=A0AAD5QGH0_PARTN|nr:hypothetical protein KIN20_000907 [Parelaphostrongylus tenuis]